MCLSLMFSDIREIPFCGTGSSVGIMTDYGLDGPGSKQLLSRHRTGRLYSAVSAESSVVKQ